MSLLFWIPLIWKDCINDKLKEKKFSRTGKKAFTDESGQPPQAPPPGRVGVKKHKQFINDKLGRSANYALTCRDRDANSARTAPRCRSTRCTQAGRSRDSRLSTFHRPETAVEEEFQVIASAIAACRFGVEKTLSLNNLPQQSRKFI